MAVSQEDIDRDGEIGRGAHARLIERLDRLTDAGAIDPTSPSTLDGWTQGMLLTHLARNADGHRRMFEGAALGEVWEQYDGGIDARLAGIEAGRNVDLATVMNDVRRSTEQLERAWATTDWVGAGRRTLTRETPITELPLLRVREVELHHIDLDVGYTVDDLDPLYVRLEVERLESAWLRRQPAECTTLPAPVLDLAAPQRLGWLTGRLEVDGLAPAGIF